MAADLVAELRQVVHPRPDRLNISDLAAVAAIGARIGALTAYACAPLGGPVGAALATARSWRGLYQDLTPFTTSSRGHDLAGHAHRFRCWADPLIRHSDQLEFANSTWLPAIQVMTTDLTDLADSVARGIDNKLAAGGLLLPFDPGTRGREHLYRAARLTDTEVVRLRGAADLVHTATSELARDVHDIDPSVHPRPARTTTAFRTGAPNVRSVAGRAPAPPSPQPGQPRHGQMRR
jgi:hypothetical protein